MDECRALERWAERGDAGQILTGPGWTPVRGRDAECTGSRQSGYAAALLEPASSGSDWRVGRSGVLAWPDVRAVRLALAQHVG